MYWSLALLVTGSHGANTVVSDDERLAVAREHREVVRSVVLSSRPKVVVVEQAAGLKSHEECYAQYQSMWEGLAYDVCHSVLDPVVVSTAAHSRERLFWVASLRSLSC